MAQATPSIIAAGTVIRGRITAEGDLEIHGHVEGSIQAGGSVTVGAEGLIKSDVEAESVVVLGAVAGNLRGTARVVLEDGARVVGDVSAPSIGIRPGAKLRGRVATGEGASTDALVAKKVVPAARPAAKPAVVPAPVTKRPAAPVTAAKPSVPPVTRPAAPQPAAAAPKVESTAKRPPEPVVPVLQKRTKKAVKRRAR